MQIGEYLKKYITLKNTPQAAKKTVSSAVEKTTGQKISVNSIKIIRGKAHISTDPYKKGVILLKKSEIIHEVANISSLKIKDIY